MPITIQHSSLTPSVDSTKGSKLKLSKTEEGCYQQLVKDLLTISKERAQHPDFATKPDNHHLYGIIFRSTQSWADVEKKMNSILEENTEKKVVEWVESWLTNIKRLRTCQNKIKEYEAELQKEEFRKGKQYLEMQDALCGKIKEIEQAVIKNSKKIIDDPNSKLLVKKLKQSLRSLSTENEKLKALQEQLDHMAKTIACLKENEYMTNLLKKRSIPVILKMCEQNLEQQLKDKKLNKFPGVTGTLEFLKNNWDKLIVFSEWLDISLDKTEDLCVKVYGYTKSFEEDEDEDYSGILNRGTKAVILVEKFESPASPLIYDGLRPGQIIRSTGFAVKKGRYGPATPPVVPSTPKKLKKELIFDFPSVDDSRQEHGLKRKKRSKDFSITGVTSQAERLAHLVELAVQKVNQTIRAKD